MANKENKQAESSSKLLNWIDQRFPYTETMKQHITEYYASKNFNIWYVFGVLAKTPKTYHILKFFEA